MRWPCILNLGFCPRVQNGKLTLVMKAQDGTLTEVKDCDQVLMATGGPHAICHVHASAQSVGYMRGEKFVMLHLL